MKRSIKTQIKTAARILGVNRLFWYIFNLLNEPPTLSSGRDLSGDDVFGHFVDSRGHKYPLIKGLRDRLKPLWRTMFKAPPETSRQVSKATLAKALGDWSRRISRVESLFSMYSTTLKGKVVVEIGAHQGPTSFALAVAGAARVIGTDIAAYYIHQTPGEEVSRGAKAAKNAELSRRRSAFEQVVGPDINDRVTFLEDDICSSSLDTRSADIILSWEVLEHVKHPAQALEQMYRILKPGGIAFHEYNPFFSQNGGHSLCTLDFPWGHTRLSPEDFVRYLQEIRPSEESVAMSFYWENLNRMTLHDLKRHATGAGFTLVSVLPWTNPQDLADLPGGVLADSKRLFPSCELIDLVSPTVWVVLRKE